MAVRRSRSDPEQPVPAVSVIVPARNAEQALGRMLDALETQTAQRSSFEVLVIDDGSTDATSAVAGTRAGVRVLASTGRGVYAARNTGIEAAAAPVLAFTDADCVPAPDWVKLGLAALEGRDDRVLAGRIDAPLGARPGVTTMLDVSHYYDQERYAREGHAAAGNLWVPASIVRAVGPFDEKLRSGGDTEFSRRVTEAGHEIVYAADVVVGHDPATRPSQLIRRSFRLGRGATARGRAHLQERRSRGAYVSNTGMLDRMAGAGHRPTRAERISLLFAKQALIRVPLVLGNLSGRVRAGSRGATAGPGPRTGAQVAPTLARKDFEREFHDQQFAHDTRGLFRRFYEVTGASRREYEDFLTARCAGRDVLEYGCSNEPYVLELARRGARAVGIDLSAVAIEQARGAAADAGVANVRFEVMDGEHLDLPDDSFDLVCGTGVLHHLDLGLAFAEIARVLRPGGEAIFIEPLAHNPALRLFRRLTPRFRTRDEHPLTLDDIAAVRGTFAAVQADFHHFLGLLAFPLRGRRGFAPLLAHLDRADRALFEHIPAARRLAWLVVLAVRLRAEDP